MKQFILASVAFSSVACAGLAPAHANLIVNGSFENGSTAPWVTEGTITSGLQALGFAPDGVLGAFISFTEADAVGRFSQSFNVAVGGTYDFRFFAGRGETTSGSNDVPLTFRALLDGQLLSDQLPSHVTSVPQFTRFTEYLASRNLDIGSHVLAFEFSRGNTLFGRAPYFVLDGIDAALAAPGGVPEPATWAMMIAGFGLVGSAARRRIARPIATIA